MNSAIVIILVCLILSSLVQGQNDTEFRCGPGYASCQKGVCCSKYGYCGITIDHCAPSRGCVAQCWPGDKPLTKKFHSAQSNSGGPSVGTSIKKQRSKRNSASEIPAIAAYEDGGETYIGDNPHYDGRGLYSTCSIPNTLALTYDDGPSEFSGELLDKLKRHNVIATFFVIGQNVKEYASFLHRAYREGHQIASHTWSHRSLPDLSDDEIIEEMKRTENAIQSVIGVRPTFMRPPFGDYDQRVLRLLWRLGYKVIIWNLDSNDWRYYNSHPHRIVEAFTQYLPFGGAAHRSHRSWIALMHELYEPTIQGQDEIIALGKRQGYRFDRVDGCLGFSLTDSYVRGKARRYRAMAANETVVA